MKRLFAMLLALTMILSLSITAFADDNTGSITITNATINETYAVYKIFDATIKMDSNNNAEGIAYTIDTDDQFFTALFGADGTTANTFFTYNANTGSVTKTEGVNDSELIKYLTELVANGSYKVAVDPVKAASDEVKFEALPYGYYLITSTLGTTVTISSNTPDVSVIDKNQKPAADFDKQIQTGVNENGEPVWGDGNTADIGEQVTYRISFSATNYDGDKQVQYYRVFDTKGDAIWAEFDSFQVRVGDEELKRGYYLSKGGENTGNWKFLGDWSGISEADRDANDAQWYLVHTGYDSFYISIPWMNNHELKKDENDVFILHFAENSASKYDSPILVEIIYDAVIEANAAIGNDSHGNRYNNAYASWTSASETQYSEDAEVVTHVYGLGLLKDEDGTWKNLAGAKFRIYSDEACTQPVYVIPTDVDGIYIRDSLGLPIENVSGTGKEATRDVFAEYLADYLKDEEGNTIPQNNLVVSQRNGKLAILGLKAGTYYLKEVEAPAGYNALSTPVALKAGENITAFDIYADANGDVADIQEETGGFVRHTLKVTHTTVHNSKGVELPSTGGEGTMMLITIGAVLAMAFAVLLITHKKMSIYHD